MDASCCIQRNIHVLNSIQINICPEYWVHITFGAFIFVLIVYNNYMIVSNNFTIRKLNESDIDLIYTLCQSNPDYYLYLNEILTKEMILDDLHCVPKGFSKENKYFVGYFMRMN